MKWPEKCPSEKEDLPHDEEAADQRIALLLYNNVPPTNKPRAAPLTTDEVNMASVVITESVDKGKNGQNGQAGLEKDLTLDEATDIIKTDEPTAATSEEKGRTEAREGTADQAGPPDGGAPL